MADFRALAFRKQGKRLRYLLVKYLSLQAAINHQHSDRRCPVGQALLRFWQAGQIFSYRVTGATGNHLVTETAREGLQYRGRETGQQPVSHARHGILLMNNQRLALHPGSDTTRPRHKTTHAHNTVRVDPAHDGVSLTQRPDRKSTRLNSSHVRIS